MQCCYVFKNKNLKGKQCDFLVCKKSEKYCCKHYYKENGQEKEINSKRQLYKNINNSKKEFQYDGGITENEVGMLFIKGTNLIVNKLKDFVVIGKMDKYMIENLDEKDILFCKENNLKIKLF